MNIQQIINKIEQNPNKSFWVVFTGLLIYQILLIFQGFELCDSGWYSTFYQNIFSNPSSVEYNSLYWFTGIIGGLFVKLFPDSGLIGIRLLSVMNVSAIVYIVHKLLNKHINNIALYIGLIIVTISFVGVPTEFFHNNLSSFLFVCASYALYKGLERNNLFLFALSGLLLAMNVFTRLPNILDIGLILIIIIHAYYYKETKAICLKRMIVMVAGFLISMSCILGIMKIMGHYDIFLRSLNGLRDVAIGNTENTHTLSSMIRVNMSVYIKVFFDGFIVTVLILLSAYFLNLINLINKKIYKWSAMLIISLVLGFFIRKFYFINLLYYFSLISLFWNIYAKEINIKILSWMGLFMLIVMPLGSDGAILNFGNYSVWITVPLAINLFINEEFAVSLKVDRLKTKQQFNFQSDNYHIKLVLLIFLAIFAGWILYNGVNSSYFDPGSRIYKTYKINSIKAKYIFTTRERATIVNDLLDGIKPFIKDGDDLIAYESIPMIYYLTNTRPFLHDSWLMGLNRASFLKILERIKKENRPLPMVIRQKFETIGIFGIPSDEYISDNRKSTMYVSQEQTRVFNQFLIDNNYKIIWENSHFVLYAPQITSTNTTTSPPSLGLTKKVKR